jgi:hypothetical protein
VPENRVLRRIFGPRRDEVTGEWRKPHNEEPHDPHPSPSIQLEYYEIHSAVESA